MARHTDTQTADHSGDNAVPYFFWDRRITVADIKRILGSTDDPERLAVMAHLMREARPDEVWQFVTPADVALEWPRLVDRLGRRRAFWEWLLASWRGLGLLG